MVTTRCCYGCFHTDIRMLFTQQTYFVACTTHFKWASDLFALWNQNMFGHCTRELTWMKSCLKLQVSNYVRGYQSTSTNLGLSSIDTLIKRQQWFSKLCHKIFQNNVSFCEWKCLFPIYIVQVGLFPTMFLSTAPCFTSQSIMQFILTISPSEQTFIEILT